MAVPNLFDPAQERTLPLTRDSGLPLTARMKVAGVEQDWPAGTTGTIRIDVKNSPTLTLDATLTGGALVWAVPPAELDTVPTGARWRMLATLPGTVPRPVFFGSVKRFE